MESYAERSAVSVETEVDALAVRDTTFATFDLAAGWEMPERSEQWRYLRQLLLTSLPLVMADLLAAALCLQLAWFIQRELPWGAEGPLGLKSMSMCGLMVVALWCFGLYPGTGLSAARELRDVTYAIVISHLAFVFAAWHHVPSRMLVFAVSCTISLLVVPLARAGARRLAARSPMWGEAAVIFGSGRHAAAVYQALLDHPEQGLRPVGIIDELANHWSDKETRPEWYAGPLSEAREIVRKRDVTYGVLIADDCFSERTVARLDALTTIVPCMVVTSPNWGPLARRTADSFDLGGIPGLQMVECLLKPGARLLKRVMDLSLILVTSPLVILLVAAVAVSILLSSPGPVFYQQERIGHRGRRFKAWKFRSMVVDAEQVLRDYLVKNPELRAEWEQNTKLRRDPRITWIGRLLRKTSLDELPQLWNVLRDEMSLVGPRPILIEEQTKYGSALWLYTRVLPGLTGLWQVMGRNNTTYSERVSYVVEYVRNWSPWFDLYLLARTIKVVLKCEGSC